MGLWLLMLCVVLNSVPRDMPPSTSSPGSGVILWPAPPPVYIPPTYPPMPVPPVPVLPPIPQEQIPPEIPTIAEGTCHFEWDYPAGIEQLAKFRIFVSRSSGNYDWKKPASEIMAVPTLTLQIPCSRLYLSAPGRYYSVIQAVAAGPPPEKPEHSNEICFEYQDGRYAICLSR